MSTERYFTYRGDVRALAAVPGGLAFVTVHPEGQGTAVYRLDPEKLALTEDALPAGGVAMRADFVAAIEAGRLRDAKGLRADPAGALDRAEGRRRGACRIVRIMGPGTPIILPNPTVACRLP